MAPSRLTGIVLLALLVAALPPLAQAGTVNVLNVTDPEYGAVPDDEGDDTWAIQAAFDALPDNGGTVYFPAGKFLTGVRRPTHPEDPVKVTVTKPCVVVGSGPNGTQIWHRNAGNLFYVALANSEKGNWLPVIFRDLYLYYDQGNPEDPIHSNGAAISYSVTPQWAWGLRVENMRFFNFYYSLRVTTAAAFMVDKCHFQGASHHEIYIDNEINADVGDSVISNSYFFSIDPSVFSAILHFGSGGLKVLGNKFIGYRYHYYNNMAYGPAIQPTGILHFSNNSSEFAWDSNLYFGGSESYNAILIQDNDFSVGQRNAAGGLLGCPSTTTAIKVQTQTGGAIRDSLITGNVFRSYGAGLSCTAIMFAPGPPPADPNQQTMDWRVADNLFNNVPTAISIGSSAERIEVGSNEYSEEVTTKIANSSPTSGSMLSLINNGFTPAWLTDGGVLFVQNGALKYRGSNGTVTTLAGP